MPGGSNVYTLRPAEVKWLFTSSGSKNGSLRQAEVKCIFTPGGRKAPLYAGESKVAFYAQREQSCSLRPTGVKWLFRTKMCFFIRILKICIPPHPPHPPHSSPPCSDYTTRRRRRRHRRNILIV